MPVRELDVVDDTISLTGAFGTLTSSTVGVSLLFVTKPLVSVTGDQCLGTLANGSIGTVGLYQGTTGAVDRLWWGSDNPPEDQTANVAGTSGVWGLYALTKPPGSTAATFHYKPFGGSVLRNSSASVAVSSVASNVLILNKFGNSVGYRGQRMAVVAVWNRQITDAEFDAIAAALSTASIYATTPLALVELNQASVATPVTDLMGLATQSAIVGTTVITNDNPPGWAFGITTPSGTGIGYGTIGGGTIGVRAPGVSPALLSGSSAGSGAAAGALTAQPRLAGSSVGASTATGALRASPQMTGSSSGAGAASGAATASSRLAGSSAGVGAASGRMLSSRYAAAVLSTSGLLGYWRLGETSGTTAVDELGARPGTRNAGVTQLAPSALSGDADTGYGFNGANGATVDVANAPAPTAAITIEAWVTPGGGDNNARIVDRPNAVTASPFSDWAIESNVGVGLAYWGFEYTSGGSGQLLQSTTPMAAGYTHLVATFDGTTANLYVNGVLDATQTPSPSGPLSSRGMPLRFGGYGPDPTIVRFAGNLDEVSIYGRALLPSEVLAHYAAGTPSAAPAALSGSSAGSSLASGALTATPMLVGSGAAVAAATGALTAAPRLVGAASGAGTSTGALRAAPQLVGAGSAQAAATGALTAFSQLVGSSAATGQATGAATAQSRLAGSAPASGSASGASTATALLAGAAQGLGSIAALLKAASMLVGSAVGVGVVSGAMTAGARVNDPILYYDMDEGGGTTLIDQSGNGRTGAIGGAPTRIGGPVGGALGLATDADFVSFAPLNMGSVYSVAIWVRWQDPGDGVLVGSGNGDYAFYIDQTDVYHSAGLGNYATTTHGGLSGWHHLTVTRSDAAVTFYKDGALLGSGTLGSPFANLAITTIGRYDNGTFPANADVDEFRVYSRALSASEVSALYSYSGSGGTAFLAGSAVGAGSVAGALSAATALSGAGSGSGATGGALSAPSLMQGGSQGSGASSGALRASPQLAGAATGAALATGALAAQPRLAGSAAGAGQQSGAMTASSLLAGSSAGTGAATGQATAAPRLAGSGAGSGAAAGSMSAVPLLSGAAPGQGAATGGLSVPGVANLVGAGVGSGQASGGLSVAQRLVGALAAAGSASGSPRAPSLLSGSSAGSGQAVGQTTVARPLVGSSASAGAASGALSASPSLAGSGAGLGAASGALAAASRMVGAATALGGMAGASFAPALLAGSGAAQGLASGLATVTVWLLGGAAGAGSASGALVTGQTSWEPVAGGGLLLVLVDGRLVGAPDPLVHGFAPARRPDGRIVRGPDGAVSSG